MKIARILTLACLFVGLAPAPEVAAGFLRSADLVFDYYEIEQDYNFPPHTYSEEDYQYTGYGRYYANGNILLEQGGYLWRRVNNSWTKESMQTRYNWIKNNAIDSSVTISSVPFQSQLSASCSPNYLCGYAGTNMLTSYLHGVTPMVKYMQDMAKKATGKSCPPQSDNDDYLLAAWTIGDAPDSYAGFLSFDTIKLLLSEGIPVHVSIKYSELTSHRCDTSWNDGHVLVVVGYSQTNQTWKVHDPLCSSSQTGAYRDIPSTKFRAAAAGASSGDDSGVHTLVVR